VNIEQAESPATDKINTVFVKYRDIVPLLLVNTFMLLKEKNQRKLGHSIDVIASPKIGVGRSDCPLNRMVQKSGYFDLKARKKNRQLFRRDFFTFRHF
jgi:hypothetical protein